LARRAARRRSGWRSGQDRPRFESWLGPEKIAAEAPTQVNVPTEQLRSTNAFDACSKDDRPQNWSGTRTRSAEDLRLPIGRSAAAAKAERA
jgi:hypothetical protein